MQLRNISKYCIDIAMLIVIVLLMYVEKTGIVFHMILGIVLFILFIVHNILNLPWWSNICRGRYNLNRCIQIILNILLFIDVFLTMISGMFYTIELHRIMAFLLFILVFVHLLIHLVWRIRKNKN